MANQQPLAVNTLGQIGLPEPVSSLAKRHWDALIIGAGHNGLACATYLAKAGKKVLVLESRDRVGGANTMEEVYPGVVMSPCAYVVGLLHPLVLTELGMKQKGFRWIPATGGSFIPFEDGTSLRLPYDDDECSQAVKSFAPEDVQGWKAMHELQSDLRAALRPPGPNDIWIGPSLTREQIETRIRHIPNGSKLMFEWSMVEFLEHYLKNEKMQMAYLGQGIIGTKASPHDPGTAYINFHHTCGTMDGEAGTWGYVVGGMGMVSFLLADIAREAGVAIATGVRVSEILPGEGVRLEGGEKIISPVVISNADPKSTLRLLGSRAENGWQKRVEQIPMEGCTVKVNAVLSELPNFKSRPGTKEPHHFGHINTPLTKSGFQECFEVSERGELADQLWTEIYLQTPHDPSVAPSGLHTMSVFAQYVPYHFKQGTWDDHREKVGDRVIESIAKYCTNLPQAILHRDVLGPPDIESKLGLTGGHIFHGEVLPSNMWDRRLDARTPMPGVFLCGAGTHPGGSVMGINGRNAAMAVLGA